MLAVIGVLAAGALIFLWEGRSLFKQKMKKEMIIFSSVLLLAVTLYIGVVLDLPIPSPTKAIGTLLEPIVKPIVLWTEGEDFHDG